ncbi:hypothetical protein BaRGS_00013140 [Batillaria attramentaria]|uniref:Uncharacterized protein n=1 Tax=Batillaria attramentaria TaxID=370345 RepID=A0ABD0L8S9_9CAEN
MDDSDSTQPLLRPDKADDDGHVSDASSVPRKYSSINTAGPQLCHSPPRYDATSSSSFPTTPVPNIQGEVKAEEYKVYTHRWYILILFSLIAATQSGVWNTFGPISATSEDAFGWHDSTIALLSNWGPISYLIVGVLFSWMMDVKGLRISCLITAFLIALGTALRCITMDPPAVTWLMHVGQMLNGLAGPVAMAGPVVVSSVWFPPEQRTTATAIGNVFAAAGNAVSFVLGPALVPDVPSNKTNTSTFDFGGKMPFAMDDSVDGWPEEHLWTLQANHSTDADRIGKERNAIRLYMYIEAGWSLALFLAVLIYFPKKPPLPPCASAAIQREDFLRGVKNLFSQGQFWVICAVYGISTGVNNCWASVLDVIIKPHHISEKEAGWIGFYASCASIVSSLLISRLADHLKRVMKWMVLLFYIICTAAFLVFTLATVKIIPPSTVLFYTTIIVGMMALSAAIPLMFEMACEVAYPTGEGTANGVLTIVNNLFGLIFLFVLMIPHIGSSWTNWTNAGAAGVCLPLLLLMKTRFRRLDIDEHHPSLTAEVVVHSASQETLESPPPVS